MNAFGRLSSDVAADFLNTVVVVDDQALLSTSVQSPRPRTLTTPSRQGRETSAGVTTTPPADAAHQLDAKELTDSFAKCGIVCAVLRPDQKEIDSLQLQLAPIASASDVVILDWVLHEFKQGEKTIEVIKELLKFSGTDKGRSRLVIVYTGENDLDQIGNSIRSALKVPEPTSSDERFTIELGAARVCIYAKEQSRLPASQRVRRIAAKDLPTVVVAEFANMTGGLVSNVALKSLAALRSNTYQLLRRFHRELDAPYVTHSTLLVPEAAAAHLVPLIVSEIQAVLEDSKVSELASLKRIASWFKNQLDRGLTFSLPQHTTEAEYRQGLSYLLKNGVGAPSLDILFEKHKKFATGVLKNKEKRAVEVVRDQLTDLLTLSADKQRVSDHELAVLMSVRSRYSSPTPHLSLGSIVLEDDGSQKHHLLCVQPRCDSVRVDDVRGFPFLPLRVVENNKKCDFIVQNEQETMRLRLSDKPFEVRMIKFAPAASSRLVVARKGKNGRFFKAAETSRKYRWIADLKPDHAQRVANDYAHKLSRVGLTESEWLRKWMPGSGE